MSVSEEEMLSLIGQQRQDNAKKREERAQNLLASLDNTAKEPGVMSFITGSDRGRGDLPELTSVQSEGLGFKTALGFISTPDVEARKDILKKNIPDVSFSQDANGNDVVTLPDGQSAFLNAPGLSGQDAIDLVSEVAKFVPAARLAAGGSLLWSVLKGGAASGTTSVAEDVAAGQLGSEQGIDPVRAGINVVAGGSAEFAAPFVNKLFNFIRTKLPFSPAELIKDGQLTRQGRIALEKAGFNPDELPIEYVESAIQLSRTGGQIPSGKVVTESGVPLSKGQATQNFDQLDLEERLRNQGNQAGQVIRSFDDKQQSRLMEITEDIQSELGQTRSTIQDKSSGGALLKSSVNKQADELLLAVDNAFESAATKNINLNRDGLDVLAAIPAEIRDSGNALSRELTPAALAALKKIERLAGKPRSEAVKSEISLLNKQLFSLKGDDGFNFIKRQAIERRLGRLQGTTESDLKSLDLMRRELGSLIKSGKNPADIRAAILIKRRFDESIDQAIDNTLFSGDSEALDLLLKARGLRADFGKRFQENTRRTRSGKVIADPGGKVVETILQRSPSDEAVVDYVLGSARLLDVKTSDKVIDSILSATKNDPQAASILKELTFRKMLASSMQAKGFSPKKFASTFTDMMEKTPTTMKKIFSKEDIAIIRNFKNDALKTVSPDNIKNPLRTADTLSRMMGMAGQAIGLQKGGIGMGAVGGRAGRRVGKVIESKQQLSSAESAVSPEFALPGRPNAATISTLIMANREGEESLKDAFTQEN